MTKTEIVWIQNLKGFIEGTFPADKRWKNIFIEQLNRMNDGEMASTSATELEPVAYALEEGTHTSAMLTDAYEYNTPLVTLSSAQSAIAERDARIAELERWRDLALNTLRIKSEEAEAAEALLKEAGKVLEPFAERAGKLDGIWKDHEANWSPAFGSTAVTIGHLRAARSLMSKIGERNGE